MEPLRGRALNSQISHDLDLPISYGDLTYDESIRSYTGEKNGREYIFILSNHDIAEENIIKSVQGFKSNNIDIESKANVILFRKDTYNDFIRSSNDTVKLENKTLTIYPQGKSHPDDSQYVYCEIKRSNDLNKNNKKRKIQP